MMPDNDALLRVMLPEWMKNFRNNLPIILKSRCVSELQGTLFGRPALVMGAGPSVYKHLDELMDAVGSGIFTIACDRIASDLPAIAVLPNIVTSIDSDIMISTFFDFPPHNTKAVFATTVNPAVLEKWSGNRYFVNAHLCGKLSDPFGPDRILDLISNKITMNTGGNVGIFSFILAAYMGANPIGFAGLDMSGHHEIYLEAAETWISGLCRDLGITAVNCSSEGNLHVPGISEMPLSGFISKYKNRQST